MSLHILFQQALKFLNGVWVSLGQDGGKYALPGNFGQVFYRDIWPWALIENWFKVTAPTERYLRVKTERDRLKGEKNMQVISRQVTSEHYTSLGHSTQNLNYMELCH